MEDRRFISMPLVRWIGVRFFLLIEERIFADESSPTSKSKPNTRAMVATRLPEQSKPKPINQKPPSNKPTKKGNKVTFNDDDQSSAGVFMTMDEISELIRAAKESSPNQNNTTTTTEMKGISSMKFISIISFVLVRTNATSALE